MKRTLVINNTVCCTIFQYTEILNEITSQYGNITTFYLLHGY